VALIRHEAALRALDAGERAAEVSAAQVRFSSSHSHSQQRQIIVRSDRVLGVIPTKRHATLLRVRTMILAFFVRTSSALSGESDQRPERRTHV
jgi:hypothetical protein